MIAQKKYLKLLVRNFYLIALLLNVIIPWILALIIIGDQQGEIQLGYIFLVIWTLSVAILYIIYFAIPDFTRQWEKIATFLFPSMLGVPILFYEFQFFIYPLVINLVFNIICLLMYMRIFRKHSL